MTQKVVWIRISICENLCIVYIDIHNIYFCTDLYVSLQNKVVSSEEEIRFEMDSNYIYEREEKVDI